MINRLEPKFITVDDYNNYHGENLREILRSHGGNDSYEAERFLAETELKLMAWIDRHTCRRLRYCDLNPRQKYFWQLALVTQAKYRILNGDLGLDSGYDQERGEIIDSKRLENLKVSDDVIDYLSNSGLFNLTVKNLPRYPHGGGPGDFTNIF